MNNKAENGIINEPYYLGLDIGTNSVGWAVTDKSYSLCKYKGKELWGIRLFESANTAEDRRLKRSSRRRLMRQHQRIDWLQEIFSEEIAKIDSTFFIRLNESRLHDEDKSLKFRHPLFDEENYTDKEFHKEYPTIFHLRKSLIEDTDKIFDIRMVYLAIHHILKNRGHFLVNGDLSEAKSLKNILVTFCEVIGGNSNIEFENFDDVGTIEFEKILSDKNLSKRDKRDKLKPLFKLNEEGKSTEAIKNQNAVIDNICKFLTGETGDLKKIIDESIDSFEDLEKTTFKFSDSKYEEIRTALEGSHPEVALVIDSIKAVYDWSILTHILSNNEYISFAKVEEYEKHKKNLKSIKEIIKKYCSVEEYKAFFNDENSNVNYRAYIGEAKKSAKEEDFYKELNKIISIAEKNSAINSEDLEKIIEMKEEIQNYTLLPLQRSKNNAVVPKQVHEVELKKILENAARHYDFLNVKDGDITAAEKIIAIFNYRIPYYVGPLGEAKNKNDNAWMVRKSEGYIYPWNFEEKVDLEKSNEEFIRRMTNKCTYLVGEDVIPKNSILYSKFMVLNELNNLRIRGKKVSTELKQNIFNDLFLKKNRVTGKALLEYIQNHSDERIKDADLKIEELSGFDKDFKANMNSYLDFKKKIFGERIAEGRCVKIAEDIIRWITIYDSDSKMVRKIIEKEYPGELNEEQLKIVSRFKYSGWGNFSEQFLNGIVGADRETGEIFTIIKALWETNNNLMQLLSSSFTFTENIKERNLRNCPEEAIISYEALVENLYVSPANKRAIWQTIQIAEEIKKVMGGEPEKIFIEMARGDEEKGDKGRKSSRKENLIRLYENCEDDVRKFITEIEETDERKFSSKKLYLYYTQMGQCMYTEGGDGKIDLDELMKNNSRWDIDHIYPQSKVVDDSLDNLVLVDKRANSKKSNERISPEIQRSRKPFWESLLKKGFISKKKYDRLMRQGDFTDEELAGFISRQLVETRQSTKAVAEIFERIYKDSVVVYVKANLVSRFRNRELKKLKSRRVNDYHHAKDAYLNIVVGNVYNAKFTSNPVLWMRNREKTNEKYSLNRVFYYDVKRGDEVVWEEPEYKIDSDGKKMAKSNEKEGVLGGGTIDRVRAVMKQNNILYTEYCYCAKGALFEENITGASGNAKVPIKKGLDIAKYGGYNGPITAYFALVEFDDKKGSSQRRIEGVPVYVANMIKNDPDALKKYFEGAKGLKNVVILRDKIKKNALISVDGFPMRIRGENVNDIKLKSNIQLKVDDKTEEIIRKIEKYLEKRRGKPVTPEFDGFNNENLIEVYDILTDKLNTVYRRRPSNKGKELLQYRDKFLKIDIEKKAAVINEIITMLRCDIATIANLVEIGGTSQVGGMTINKNTLGKSKLVLINQSVTGIFEQRIVL